MSWSWLKKLDKSLNIEKLKEIKKLVVIKGEITVVERERKND